MDLVKLNALVLSLLETECSKTVDYLVEELRMEYPEEFKKIMGEFQKEYSLSGCGAEMSPITAVNASLNYLYNEGKVEKERRNGFGMWRLK
ncbi:MAG: hypothetical protein ACOX4H_10845 [Bacillota bacterium]|nr:hypothetical protein [Clostridia bacterium]